MYVQREKTKELGQAVMKHKLLEGDSSGKHAQLQQHLKESGGNMQSWQRVAHGDRHSNLAGF